MKKLLFAVSIVCFLAFFLSVNANKNVVKKAIFKQTPPVVAPLFSEEKLWNLVQDWRKSQGFSLYIKDQRLCSIAEDRVNNDPPMDDHAGFYKNYSSYPYVLSENLAAYSSEQQMLKEWLGSPTHKANLEKPYTYSCIACRTLKNGEYIDNGRTYCSEIFSSFLKN